MPTALTPGSEFLFDDGSRALVDVDGSPVTKVGWDTMRDITKKLCDAVQKFAPFLRRVLDKESPVLLFLELTEIVCAWAVTWLTALANDASIAVVDGSLPEFVASLRSLSAKWDEIESNLAGA